jgi:hypothetical protein
VSSPRTNGAPRPRAPRTPKTPASNPGTLASKKRKTVQHNDDSEDEVHTPAVSQHEARALTNGTNGTTDFNGYSNTNGFNSINAYMPSTMTNDPNGYLSNFLPTPPASSLPSERDTPRRTASLLAEANIKKEEGEDPVDSSTLYHDAFQYDMEDSSSNEYCEGSV